MSDQSQYVGKWGISADEVSYTEFYDSSEEAEAEAKTYGYTAWVGQFVAPPAPEEYIHASMILERITSQDEYSSDFAEGAFVLY